MDSFDKIKEGFDEALERARSKVHNRVDTPHSSHVSDIRAGARERLAALKNKSGGSSAKSSAVTQIRDSGDDTTQIREADSIPTQILESDTLPTEIQEPVDDPTQIHEIDNDENLILGYDEHDTQNVDTEERATQILDTDEQETIIVPREPDPTRLMSPEDAPDFVEDALSPLQRHQIDRAFAHLMHSVVKMCFYNLKVFCPSMADEFDEEVREQVVSNIGRLTDVKTEVDSFFAQSISEEKRIDAQYQDVARQVQRDVISLIELAQSSVDNLSEENVRSELALEIPKRIDHITDQLQLIRAELDASKYDMQSLLEKSVALHSGVERPSIDLTVAECPRVFANERKLVSAFTELIANSVKYSAADHLKITATHIPETQMIEIIFEDDGKGMTEDELKQCFERGFTTGGTGEGLAMVMEYIELEHLGSIQVASTSGHGVQFTILLPVIFQNQSAPRD